MTHLTEGKDAYMNYFEQPFRDYRPEQPATPTLPPLFGAEKLWEMENDYSYLKYLYPDKCGRIRDLVEEECDRLEYEGSLMFDLYPDKIQLQRLARKILMTCNREDPEAYPADSEHLRELTEIILYHEVLFRRNRYRSRKRLYY